MKTIVLLGLLTYATGCRTVDVQPKLNKPPVEFTRR